MKRFDVLTIFPKIFNAYCSESLFKKAVSKRLISIKTYNLRDYLDKNTKERIDDRPFGGGPGMVMKLAPIYRAINKIKANNKSLKSRVILFSTRGKLLDAKTAKRLSKYDRLIMICGHYEGVDERVAEYIADEEISIGSYILTGGELPALVTMDAVSRFFKGFLGKKESLEENRGSFPAYSRPAVFNPKRGIKWIVPDVLMSGNHKKINEWRKGTSPSP